MSSSLTRYKKAGGFLQLLTLLETFGPQKREKFLEMIEQESPTWANAIREKMISIDRIFTWPDDLVSDVFSSLPPKNMAYALSGLPEAYREKVMKFMSVSDKRRMETVWTENKPTADEVASTLVQVVDMARKMMNDKKLHPEKFDESLTIPEDFEMHLDQQHKDEETNRIADGGSSVAEADPGAVLNFSAVAGGAKDAAHAPGTAGAAEVASLQKSLSNMARENKLLKDEVRVLKDKLDRIKKIA